MNLFKTNKLLKIILFLGMIVGIYLMLQSENMVLLKTGDIESLQTMLHDNIQYTLFLTFIFMIIQNAIALFPLLLLVTINVILFGFFYGYLWSFLISVLASIIVFLITRYYLQDILIKKLNSRIKDKIEANGFTFIFLARIFPFLPTSVINVGAGLSSISFIHFSLATFFGNSVYIFFLALIPLGVMTNEFESILLAVTTLGIIAIIYLYRRKRKVIHTQNPKSTETSSL